MSELISAGVGPFGNAQDPDIVSCAVCGDPVQHADKFMVEREIIHKACFICAFCDGRLQMGYCVQELALYNRYGPCWYCSLICAHRPLAEKEAKLKENGVEVRVPSTRRPRAKSGQGGGINIAPAGATQAAPPAACPEAAAPKQPENPVEVENDGPEIEAEEIGAEEMPKKAEENWHMAAPEGVTSNVEASKGDGGEGGIQQGDGEEMEAEEVVKTTAKEEAVPQSEEGNVGAEGGEAVSGQTEGGGEVGQAEMGTEEGIPPETPTKEAKPVAMDAYENKYRLQMKKKK